MRMSQNSETLCTANWRGYQAIWSITEKELLLSYVISNPCDDSHDYINLTDFFGIWAHTPAKWYSGTITYRISEYSRLKENGNRKGGPVKYSRPGKDGIQFQAVVYVIYQGEVKSRSIKTIRHVYD